VCRIHKNGAQNLQDACAEFSVIWHITLTTLHIHGGACQINATYIITFILLTRFMTQCPGEIVPLAVAV